MDSEAPNVMKALACCCAFKHAELLDEQQGRPVQEYLEQRTHDPSVNRQGCTEATHLMLIDLALAVQLEGGDTIKDALCSPRDSGNAMNSPPHPIAHHQILRGLSCIECTPCDCRGCLIPLYTRVFYLPDLSIIRLPDSLHIDIQSGEEESSMEAQAPEYGLVILQALERVPRISKHNVLPVDVICNTETGLSEGPHAKGTTRVTS